MRSVAASCLLALACAGSPAPKPTPTPAPPEAIAMPPSSPAPNKPAYPATRKEAIVDTIFGVKVADPYRWLEDVTSPEVQAWMKEQNDFTRAALDALPHRAGLQKRLAEVFYYDALGAPIHRKGRYFWSHKHQDREKTVVYWKQGDKGKDQVLFDPNAWSSDGSVSLGGWWPSPDGRLVAYNVKANNADESVMQLVEVATGKKLGDELPGTKYAAASWTRDGKGFYYTWVPPIGGAVTVADRPGFAELRYHAVGSDPVKDPIVFPATGDPQTFVGGFVSKDGRWLIAVVQHGWNSSDVYFKDLEKNPKEWTTLVKGVEAVFDPSVWKGRFYVMTNDGAARYRVYQIDPAKPSRAQWKEIVPEAAATLEAMTIVGDKLVLSYLDHAANKIEVRNLDGTKVRDLALPPLGSTLPVVGEPDEDTAYVVYSSFTEAQIVYKTSIKTGEVSEYAKVALAIDTSNMVTEQVRYPSKDGTEITMFIIRGKDRRPDGQNPTILYGYGGFNVSLSPNFASSWAVWVERGGIVAIPNLRGGGEYGEDWHKAGMLLNKQNVFDDYIAAARYLVDQKWTNRDRLAIYGGSNGGLLVGAAMTQAPERFAAVICGVPLLDMVRYHLFGSGKTWIPEYGSAEDKAQFAALYAYSPYHHVEDGVAYPALLMLAADSDDRVDPMHARKFSARVQAATSSARPVLLRIEKNAGHGGADLVRQKVEQSADMFAFLLQQFGL